MRVRNVTSVIAVALLALLVVAVLVSLLDTAGAEGTQRTAIAFCERASRRRISSVGRQRRREERSMCAPAAPVQ